MILPSLRACLQLCQVSLLCWDRANGGSETPVVSQTSFGCPGPTIVNETSTVSKSIFQYSLSTSVLAEEQTAGVGSRSDVRQVSFCACFARFRAILTRFPHVAFSVIFLIVLPPSALYSRTPYSRMSPLYVFFPLSPCIMSLSRASPFPRAILTRFPHIAFSATFFIVLPPPALCSHTPYSHMSPLYVLM